MWCIGDWSSEARASWSDVWLILRSLTSLESASCCGQLFPSLLTLALSEKCPFDRSNGVPVGGCLVLCCCGYIGRMSRPNYGSARTDASLLSGRSCSPVSCFRQPRAPPYGSSGIARRSSRCSDVWYLLSYSLWIVSDRCSNLVATNFSAVCHRVFGGHIFIFAVVLTEALRRGWLPRIL
jgi:hypothetical protein